MGLVNSELVGRSTGPGALAARQTIQTTRTPLVIPGSIGAVAIYHLLRRRNHRWRQYRRLAAKPERNSVRNLHFDGDCHVGLGYIHDAAYSGCEVKARSGVGFVRFLTGLRRE